jgi:hypothetical protein
MVNVSAYRGAIWVPETSHSMDVMQESAMPDIEGSFFKG